MSGHTRNAAHISLDTSSDLSDFGHFVSTSWVKPVARRTSTSLSRGDDCADMSDGLNIVTRSFIHSVSQSVKFR